MEEKEKEIKMRTIKALEPELQQMSQLQLQREKNTKQEMEQKYEELQKKYEKEYREKLNDQQKQLLETFEHEHNTIRDHTIQQLKEELVTKSQEYLIEKKMIERKFHEELYNVEREREKEVEMYRDKLRRQELQQEASNICSKCRQQIKEQEAVEIIERNKFKIIQEPIAETAMNFRQKSEKIQAFEDKNYVQDIQLNDDYLNEFLEQPDKHDQQKQEDDDDY